MLTIVTLSLREINRLRGQFRGGSRPVVALLLLGAALVAYLTARQGAVLSQGMYRVGVSPGAPAISDPRFAVLRVDRALGADLLSSRRIDLYLDADGPGAAQVRWRADMRSQYAVGALRRVLERAELERLAAQYPLDDAFPLRVDVRNLPPLELAATPVPGGAATPVPSGAATPDASAAAVSLAELLVLPTPVASASAPSAALPGSGGDAAVIAQLADLERGNDLSNASARLQTEAASSQQIIIPSLMNPPIPFAQVILAFLYVMPVFFISVFFTSSFMEEKAERRISLLLSAPVTPLQIIVGKMLPYLTFALLGIVGITAVLRGSILLTLAIFLPMVLFILSAYLMIPLLYRTFKDTTFFSMLAITLITSYLVFPAMFSGINDLAYMSPLTLAVKMYRQEPFGLREYLFATLPLLLMAGLWFYLGTRMLNEEYLLGFRPLYRKLAQALALAVNRRYIQASLGMLGVALVPGVYVVQLVLLAFSLNLPPAWAVAALLVAGAIVEEVAKSAGLAVLLEDGTLRTWRGTLLAAVVSACGFLLGEKLLLAVSLSIVTASRLSLALAGGSLLLAPLAGHIVFTAIVAALTRRWGARYWLGAVGVGSAVHIVYNLIVAGVLP